MILYVDTSALVKLYDEEEGTEVVEQALEEAELVATSVVAYAEARAALARKAREGVFSEEEHREAVAALDEDWETFEKLEATASIARAAGDLPTHMRCGASTRSTWPPPCWFGRQRLGNVVRGRRGRGALPELRL